MLVETLVPNEHVIASNLGKTQVKEVWGPNKEFINTETSHLHLFMGELNSTKHQQSEG